MGSVASVPRAGHKLLSAELIVLSSESVGGYINPPS